MQCIEITNVQTPFYSLHLKVIRNKKKMTIYAESIAIT